MKNNLLMTVIVAVVVGAIGFFGGMQYQKMQKPQGLGFAGAGGGRFNQQFGGRNGNGARPVVGEILSADDKSITVKLMDGSTKIVLVSSSTSINKAATATMSDLKTGERVAAFGTANSDGSITATNIQLNPQMRIFQSNVTPSTSK